MARFFALNSPKAPLESEICNTGEIMIKSSKKAILRHLTINNIHLLFFGTSKKESTTAYAKKIRRVVIEFIDQVYGEGDFTHGLFILRSHLATQMFDKGRWHQDGMYFDNPTHRIVYKYGATFVGPPTLFKIDNKIVTPTNCQGYRWIIGDEAKATIHSEPLFTSPRIFCALLPCTRTECAQIWPKLKNFELT
jgi:hypothetical protein